MENSLHKKILAILKEDARYTAAQIAVMTGAEENEVVTAIKEFEQKGIIVKYSTVINEAKINDDIVDAFIEVRMTPQKGKGYDAVAEQICAYNEVKDVYLMSGGYDLAVTIEGKSLREVSSFVHEKLAVMDCVISTTTHFILKYYKVSKVVLDGEKKDKRVSI